MTQAPANSTELSIRTTGSRMELNMPSDPALLRPVRVALEEFCAEAGLDCQTGFDLGLVLNEALANVMRHGYGGATDKPIVLIFDRRDPTSADGKAELEITIRDWAKPFDPAKLPKDPPPVDPDTIKPGGLGLLCMRRYMDEVVFTPLADGMMLKMVKKFSRPGSM
jgi:anti-sigma regulatory factor (Ser/Thr protein kinase)